MYFNTNLIFRRGEVWRLLTNFFFFGSLGLDFVFHMFFLVKYCKSLEEGEASFYRSSADAYVFGGAQSALIVPHVPPGQVLQGPGRG